MSTILMTSLSKYPATAKQIAKEEFYLTNLMRMMFDRTASFDVEHMNIDNLHQTFEWTPDYVADALQEITQYDTRLIPYKNRSYGVTRHLSIKWEDPKDTYRTVPPGLYDISGSIGTWGFDTVHIKPEYEIQDGSVILQCRFIVGFLPDGEFHSIEIPVPSTDEIDKILNELHGYPDHSIRVIFMCAQDTFNGEYQIFASKD